jgi:hypothetical protein
MHRPGEGDQSSNETVCRSLRAPRHRQGTSCGGRTHSTPSVWMCLFYRGRNRLKEVRDLARLHSRGSTRLDGCRQLQGLLTHNCCL